MGKDVSCDAVRKKKKKKKKRGFRRAGGGGGGGEAIRPARADREEKGTDRVSRSKVDLSASFNFGLGPAGVGGHPLSSGSPWGR